MRHLPSKKKKRTKSLASSNRIQTSANLHQDCSMQRFIHITSILISTVTCALAFSPLSSSTIPISVSSSLSSSSLSSTAIVPPFSTTRAAFSLRLPLLRASVGENHNDDGDGKNENVNRNGAFDLDTALFCGGLAFDAYAEPPANSSRWEKGSSGLNVAFQSPSFTRSLYKGLIEITPQKCTDLPDEDDTTEGVLTGSGTDAYLLVAVAEGAWTSDITLLETEQYHDGVLALQGCAHVGRSSTAWSNVRRGKSDGEKKRGGRGVAYHVPSSWNRGGEAVWEGDEPFYLYVQDPRNCRLVFTVMDDDVVGRGSPVGSACYKLKELIPAAARTEDPVSALKERVLERIKGAGDREEVERLLSGKDEESRKEFQNLVAQEWNGKGRDGKMGLKLTNKPKKKDKNGQIATAMAAGAMVAGPAGAALGGLVGSLYEGDVRGRVFVNIRYMPILDGIGGGERKVYQVKGGLPGVNWGLLYEQHLKRTFPTSTTTPTPHVTPTAEIDNHNNNNNNNDDEATTTTTQDAPPSTPTTPHLGGNDFEFCSFVTHDSTGCSCAIYRSLEKKLIAVSFRGTCAPIDLVTDASIIQETWVEGENPDSETVAKVHLGFRKSLNSISRRLKELVLASVAPGEDMSQYDLIVTGHSLGGALSTLFTADVAQHGIDAGRGLPQLEPSEPWWNALSNVLINKGKNGLFQNNKRGAPPPRPKSVKMYNFGSPRVGNRQFVEMFDSLIGNGIDEAYRIVNGQDVVARLPRTVNTVVAGLLDYEHCGPTVLLSLPNVSEEGDGDDEEEEKEGDGTNRNESEVSPPPLIWIEGQSDDSQCPVRDGNALQSPLAKGSLLGDIVSAVTSSNSSPDDDDDTDDYLAKGDYLSKLGNAMKNRMESFTAADLGSIVGIDKKFVEREAKIIQSLVSGKALSHHMEDQYYLGMGRACGFVALVGEEIRPIESLLSSSSSSSLLSMSSLMDGGEGGGGGDGGELDLSGIILNTEEELLEKMSGGVSKEKEGSNSGDGGA